MFRPFVPISRKRLIEKAALIFVLALIGMISVLMGDLVPQPDMAAVQIYRSP
jgi:hypothetical protein